MDAHPDIRRNLGQYEEELNEQPLKGDNMYPLQRFTNYHPQMFGDLGFSNFLKDEGVDISVNWESLKIMGPQKLIQQIVSEFEADIVWEDLELKKPGIQNMIFDNDSSDNVNILYYIQRILINKSIKHYYLSWIPDYKTPDEVKGNIYCRSRADAFLAKTVIEKGFCSFPRADESSDVKEVIRSWKEKRKLVETVALDGQKTITCTLDVKRKIEEERNKILKKSNPVRAAYAQFLAKHSILLDTISQDMHVKIHFNSDINTLVLEGTHSNIKLAVREIKSKTFEDSLDIQTYPTGNLAQEFNKIADTYNCGWTVQMEGKPQEIGHLTGCEYVASWYDPTRNTSFTVIEGGTHDLNVDCLIALCTDKLFPLQFKQGKEMAIAIQDHLERANKSHDVGDVVFKYFENTNYKNAAFLVAGLSNPPSKGANKTFHGLSSKLKSVFMKAETNHWKTVCLPACREKGFLSTNSIVEAYLDAVITFQKEKKPLQFYLFCEKGKGLGIQDLLKNIQKRYKAEIGFFRQIHQHGVYKFKDLGKNSKPCIEVTEESIENMKVDIIVNTASKNLDLKPGKVSNKLQSLAGDEMPVGCKRQYPNSIDYTTVAVTSPYRLKNTNRYINYVFHGAIPKFKRDSYVQNVKSFVWCCLAKADSRKCKSIAFPALGTGSLGYPGREAAKAMFDAVEEYRTEAVNPHVKIVVFSLYSGDKDICMIFEREEQRRRALNDVAKTKYSHQPYTEIKTNARTLIGTISRKPHPVKVIVGVSTDIGPLNSNVVEIKTVPSKESDIKWKYSNDQPQTLNDQLLVSRRESKHSHTETFRRKPNDNSFKGAINNALKYCISNNIAEIAFDIDPGTADVTDSDKVDIIASELEHCLSGRQEEVIVLHTIYVRLIDIHQFDSVTMSLLDNRWLKQQARSLFNSVNPLGSNLNWQIQDASTNDKHVRLEIVGESPEAVQTVKQQMLQEASRFYDDSSSARSDIESSVDNGYNGARPKTRQLDEDKNTEQITLSDRFMEKEENPHTSEESEEDFDACQRVFEREEQRRRALNDVVKTKYNHQPYKEIKTINPLGSNLNWQIQDSSTNDKHARLEIVGESPEVVQTVKQQMLQEASRFYDDSSSARSDIESSVDNGYNGARPKTRQLDEDKNTEQITLSGRFMEKVENPHTSEESEEDFDAGEVFEREEQRRRALNDVVKTKYNHQPYKEIKTINPLGSNLNWQIQDSSTNDKHARLEIVGESPEVVQTVKQQMLQEASRFYDDSSSARSDIGSSVDNGYNGARSKTRQLDENKNTEQITLSGRFMEKVENPHTSEESEEDFDAGEVFEREEQRRRALNDVVKTKYNHQPYKEIKTRSNLNWQIQDASTNDKHVRFEIVGESPEAVQTVKQQMQHEASRFSDESSSERSDIESSVDNGYNGARPKTRQLDEDKNTEQITLSGRFMEKVENPHTSEESEEDFDAGEGFKVSAQINPVYIKFKERYNDAERRKDLVEKTYGVKMSTDEHQGCRVHGTYRQIIDTKTYLDKKFPLDPTPIQRKKRSINISQRKESDKMLVNTSLTSDPGKGLDIEETHYKHEETLFLNGGELESLLFMKVVSYSCDNKPSQMKYDEGRSALVIIGTDKCLKEVKEKHSKIMQTVTRREVKLITMDETSQGDAAVNQTVDDKVLCKFTPQEDTIAIVGVDERSAKEFEKRIFKFLGRNGSNPNMGPGDENTTRQPSGLEMPKHSGKIGKQKSDGMTVKIYKCQMDELSVDCLVVPYSTKSLPLTVRVMKAAGDKFKKKLKETIQNLGPFTSCECRETDPGKLENLKKIIHMSLDEKSDGINTNMLHKAVTNSLRKANELDMEKVAILITGVNYSVNFSHLMQYFNAIKGFTRETTRPNKVKEIHLVHHNDQITNEAKDTFRRMSAREGIETQGSDFIFLTARTWNHKSSGVQPYPNTRPLQEPGTFVVGRSNVNVLAAMGDVRSVQADGIVCVQDEFFTLGSPTAKDIYDLCGEKYRSKIHEAGNLTKAEGYILAIPTAGGNIKCKFVINVVLPKWKLELPEGEYVSTLKGTVSDILQKSEELKLKSLAMPYLESYDLLSDERTTSQPFCEAMVSSILQFFKNDKQFHLKRLEVLVENHILLSDLVQMFKQFGKDV